MFLSTFCSVLLVFHFGWSQDSPEVAEATSARSATEALAIEIDTLGKPENSKNIAQSYNEVSDLWEKVADHLKASFYNVPDTGETQSNASMANWQAEVASRFSLLRKVSRVRANHLRELNKQNISLFNTDNKTFRRMGMEVTLIPYKFLAYFYQKAFWFKSQLKDGLSGVYSLVFELLILLSLLLIPFIFIRLSRVVEKQIESQKRKSFYLSFRSRWHRNLTNFLPVLSEYLPWLFTLVAIEMVSGLLEFSEFKEFKYLLPYAYYFVYYKLFRVTLELGLREFVSKLPMDSKEHLNKKIQNTSKFLGSVLLVIYSLKAAFHSILGQSLIFFLIEPFFGLLILFMLFYVSARWELEIEKYLKNTNIIFFQKYAARMENRYSLFLSLPGLILIVFHFTIEKLVSWSSQFDLAKVLYARVLRVKYESTRSDSSGLEKIDDEYKEKFLETCNDSWKNFVFEKDFFKRIDRQVEAWIEDQNMEQTVAIYGPKGSGKSVFLKQSASYFENKNYRCESISVPPRVFTEKSFEQLLDPVFKKSKEEKVIVLLDNAHNLFLSTIGGFKIYQMFLEKTEEFDNIFWIASYNEYSWQFLNSIQGENQYFRLELTLPRWSAQEIKEMILTFHSQLDYKLDYDQIFRSNQRLNEEVTSAENRYFYLIWERSHGNPGLAIYYWFKSLRRVGPNHLKVCLPFENPVGELSKLHQEMHFVYASLMKHENLNISEASRATNLPRAMVKQAIYRGLEEGFLKEEGGRYTVRLEWIDDLKKYLRGKNLIYEING